MAPPAEALAKAGAPDRIRTCGLQIRNLPLYPTELRARDTYNNLFFLNSLPEPDFKYCSNDIAFNSLLKQIYTTNSQGIYFLVCAVVPQL